MAKSHLSNFVNINLTRSHIIKKLLIVMTVLLCFPIDESYGVNWPLRISASGKYLEDQSGVPFQINADAGWHLTTQISREDAVVYLDDRLAKGFNAVEIRVIDHTYQSNPPNNYYGNPPFTNHLNWSTVNEVYWTNVDYIVSAAKDRGMLILMFPSYLGYNCTDGQCADMQAQTNAAMTTYGTWIGSRYYSYGNILWMRGGDNDCADYTNACARDAAMVTGVRTGFPGALFAVEPDRYQIGGIDSYTSGTDINSLYSSGTDTARAQTAYASSRPWLYQEGFYENEHSTSTVDSDGEAFTAFLGGGLAGRIFGSCPIWSFGSQPGFCNSSSYPFNTWQNNMNSPASISHGNIGKLMRSRKWWTLVPDYTNVVVTSAKGSGASYHSTARETTGETVMVWCPNTNQVTVDMTKISGTQAKAWWWNPDNNTSVLIGTYNTTGTRNFTPSSARKVLVLDNTASSLAAPGTTVYSWPSPPTNLRVIP